MGPKRTAKRGASRGRPARKSAKRAKDEQDDVPDIYQEMLAEAARNPLSNANLQVKVVKQRKLDDGSSQVTNSELMGTDLPNPAMEEVETAVESNMAQPSTHKQIIFDDFDASYSDSESEFEDVDLEADVGEDSPQKRGDEPLHLDLSRKVGPDVSASLRRRKPATATERKIRLGVHKWHLLCLLAHLQWRNHWCDDEKVQDILKPLVPRKIIRLLHLDASQPQYQRTHSFHAALEDISKMWRREWKITEQGMRRAYWKEDPDDVENIDDSPDPIDHDDFRDAAKTRSGSRDLGAQLFCALLRALAVDTRLVFSLQPLSFSGAAKGTTPEKPKPRYIMAESIGRQPQWNQNGDSSVSTNPRSRLYDAKPDRAIPVSSARMPTKRTRDSPYPIFWVEVFDESLQKWTPVDPLVRCTINKPKTGFEPPASDLYNRMTYVIAFEDDGSAKDVTRRYAQFYNGKTRRNRVESAKEGKKWWDKTMSFFEKPFPEDRDAIEDAELLAREESEQMPKSIQDFKNHPHYALERHLRRNEVIHPKREIGKVSVGLSRDGKLEPVFRRRHVLVVKTADQWYRLGRDVKIGEQPVKRVVPLKRRATPEEDDGDQEEAALLYAEFQTELYMPPDVVNGKIPKNVYGNLDVYVPSMIPAGGIHVQHPDAAKAANILGISYADAVTGFEFKGRQGTAIMKGIVAASEYREALVEVLEGLAYQRAQNNSEKRSQIALHMWKKFLTALRIRERVNTKYGGGSQSGGDDDYMEDETYQDEDAPDEEDGGDGGGFFPEHTQGAGTLPQYPEIETSLNDLASIDPGSTEDVEAPIVIIESPHKLPREQQQQQQESPEPLPPTAKNQSPQEPIIASGDFLPNRNNPLSDDDGGKCGDGGDGDEGGGFIMEDASVPQSPQATTPNPESLNPSPSAPAAATASQTPKIPQPEPDAEATANPPETSHPAELPPPSSSSSSSSSSSLEQGSLLSHDPDDSDAEPEWLADALDSD
jgi:xeroderma pigmentosum group C-complementing protein